MSVHFNLKRLRPNLDGLGFLIDVGMILLVIANLSLILFDWIYRVEAVQSAMETYTPDFYRFYSDSIHANFFEIDLAFVSVYLTEFVIRWSIGVHGKNLFDQRYIVSGYDFVTGSVLGLEGNLTAFYGDPRRVFVTGQVKF